ncbi:tetratricopeptide repeat protein [Candidatus Uhrbacteria bacterium]|nr:tetratricopeptide repeat protein [Candidatus Uhrbacteria bacterium]
MWFLLSLIGIAVSLVVIGFIVARHLAQLRILNIEALPEVRERKVKTSLFTKRLERLVGERWQGLRKRLVPLEAVGQRLRSRFEKRISELELSYLRAKRVALGSRGKRTAQIVELLREADELARQGRTEEAERKYVAVVKLDPKQVDAYEGLGNLYLKLGRLDDATEALGFILKFRPDDASVRVSLGEVALARGKPEEALPEFAKAVELRPGNPKYLDFFIETAIVVGNRKEAERGLKLIREANPENQKIPEWEKKIADL